MSTWPVDVQCPYIFLSVCMFSNHDWRVNHEKKSARLRARSRQEERIKFTHASSQVRAKDVSKDLASSIRAVGNSELLLLAVKFLFVSFSFKIHDKWKENGNSNGLNGRQCLETRTISVRRSADISCNLSFSGCCADSACRGGLFWAAFFYFKMNADKAEIPRVPGAGATCSFTSVSRGASPNASATAIVPFVGEFCSEAFELCLSYLVANFFRWNPSKSPPPCS